MAEFAWLKHSEDAKEIRSRLSSIVQTATLSRQSDPDRIGTIYLFLTRKCNLSCQHCYINGVGPNAQGRDMGMEDIASLIEQGMKQGLTKVKVSGGEPMAHPEFPAIMKYLSRIGLKEIVLETNGTLIKDATLDLLSSIPNLTVFVSLDHIEPEEHDAFRRQRGAHAKATGSIRRLCTSGIDTIVTTTAFRNNVAHVIQIVDLVIGWGAKRHRTLLNIHPIGNARSTPTNALTLEECETLIEALVNSEHVRTGRAYVTLPPALTPPSLLSDVSTCGWGDNVLGILSNGQISMCSASYDDREMIAGNALETPLLDIWKSSPLFNDLRSVGAGNVDGICGNCIFYEACRGVCKMSSWSHYGSKRAPYPLCQEAYNSGKFPMYALVDPDRDCTYQPGRIAQTR